METEIFVDIGSGDGLLPNGTQPLPEPMLTGEVCVCVCVCVGGGGGGGGGGGILKRSEDTNQQKHFWHSPEGRKPLHKPMLTKIYDTIWCHKAIWCKPLAEPMTIQFTCVYASSGLNELTHLPLDKWPPFHTDDISLDAFSSMNFFLFWLKFHWSLFLMVKLTITQHWFEIMAWRRIGDKSLSEPMLPRFTDAYMWH